MPCLALIAFFFLLLRAGIAFVNFLGPTRLLLKSSLSKHRVSVLIPARDEEHNIRGILQGLLQQSLKAFQILVYDDGSEDHTSERVEEMIREDSTIELIHGKALPAGWLGKNHACHQLAKHATGDYLLFLDADVRVSTSLLNDMLAHMEHHDLDLLSVFPVQEMRTMGERLSVPLMNHFLLSFLPLPLTRLSRRPSLAAANGQCMLFKAKTYQAYQFHAMVRHDAVEDIRIMKEMKKLGFRTEVLLSQGQISCRMYHSYRQALAGFARNFHHFFGEKEGLMVAFGIWTSLAPLFCFLAHGAVGLSIYLLGLLLLRITTALASRQPVYYSILLMPWQHLSMLHIMIHGIYTRKKHKLAWKGRGIDHSTNNIDS